MNDHWLSTAAFVSHLSHLDRTTSGLLACHKVNFEPDLFLTLLRETPLHVIPSSDGLISVVQEGYNPIDFSRQSGPFDWHTDGLYYPHVPDLVILFCENPGQAPIPTVFSDTRTLSSNMQSSRSWEVLNQLDLVYISKSGETHPRPLIEAHPWTTEPTLHLGSRAFLRPHTSGEQLPAMPSLREIAAATTDLYQALDTHLTLRHSWQAGDLLLFDNHSYVHGRESQAVDPHRKLFRIWLSLEP